MDGLPPDCVREIVNILEQNAQHDTVWSLRLVCVKLHNILNRIIGVRPYIRGMAIGMNGSIDIFLDTLINKELIMGVFLGALSKNCYQILDLFEVTEETIFKEIPILNDQGSKHNYPLVRVTYVKTTVLINPKIFLRSLGECGDPQIIAKYTKLYPYSNNLHRYIIEGSLQEDDPDKSIIVLDWLTRQFSRVNITRYFRLIHRTAAIRTLERIVEPDIAYRDDYMSFLSEGRLASPVHASYSRNVQFLCFIESFLMQPDAISAFPILGTSAYWNRELMYMTGVGSLIAINILVESGEKAATKAFLLEKMREYSPTRYSYINTYSNPKTSTIVEYIIEIMGIIGPFPEYNPQKLYGLINIKELPVGKVVMLFEYLIRQKYYLQSSLCIRDYFVHLSPMSALEFLSECEKRHLSLNDLGLKDGHLILAITKDRGALNPRWPLIVNRELQWLCHPSRSDSKWNFFFKRLDCVLK